MTLTFSSELVVNCEVRIHFQIEDRLGLLDLSVKLMCVKH